jgi:hypothetical protein
VLGAVLLGVLLLGAIVAIIAWLAHRSGHHPGPWLRRLLGRRPDR